MRELILCYARKADADAKAADLKTDGYTVKVVQLEALKVKTYSPMRPQTTTIWEEGRAFWRISAIK